MNSLNQDKFLEDHPNDAKIAVGWAEIEKRSS